MCVCVCVCVCVFNTHLQHGCVTGSLFLKEEAIFPKQSQGAHTVKENAEALLVATKEIGLEVNADKTKYMVMSRDRNAGRGHSVKIDNMSIERMEEFKYLGTPLTDQNSIQRAD